MAQDEVTQSLLAAHKALLEEYGELFSRSQIVLQDIQNLEAMLARHGYWAPMPITDYAAALAEPPAPPVPPPQPVQTMDEIISKMVADSGVPDTAVRYIEYIFGMNQVAAPAQVRQLLDAFPPVLRQNYHQDSAVATEALRAQIRSRVDSGTTTLSYENGYVGIKGASQAV
jgi:hypothetical protein